ncbi:MAG: diaminopimelate epimerase [Saprospiraceae bacterium]
MTSFPFTKYHGAGNDFVIVNHFNEVVLPHPSPADIAALCHRHFGIGSDGLMILERDEAADFRMQYFNADGHESTLCGNGSRCIVAFAHHLGIIEDTCVFRAIDGLHQAVVGDNGDIAIEMNPVTDVQPILQGVFLNTGSPHYVQQVAQLTDIDITLQGRALRQNSAFAPGGSNINFISGDYHQLSIATYERGVEGETLACGTGVTAAAIYAVKQAGLTGDFTIPVEAKGGSLRKAAL